MNPAFSVIFLTTLIGAAQGLLAVLVVAEWTGMAGHGFLASSGAVAVLLAAAGLLASFFHLGHPERAWRAAAMWRTSWLSREVIVLPAFMGATALWVLGHAVDLPVLRAATPLLAAAALAMAVLLFVCTAMIYASLRFLQEWASAYTLVNYTLLGLASGATLALALAALAQGLPAAELTASPALLAVDERLPRAVALWALLSTLAGGVSRALSLRRNARIKPKSTLQTAIGLRHPRIRQTTQGFMGGSFNTREFFHGKGLPLLRQVKWVFLLLAFVLPVLVLAALLMGDGVAPGSGGGLWLALFLVQYLGLLAERWFFFAQARHPQNLYYQAVA
ncbi:MAG: hypothetical protein RLZZ584_3796 [Pseudomonadota bacterium]